MNSTVKKFKRVIENERKRIMDRLSREFNELYNSNVFGMFEEIRNKIDTGIINEDVIDQESDIQTEKLYRKFEQKHRQEIEFSDNLALIIKCFNKEGFFSNYDILEKCFLKLEFSETEKTDIYAYFLNKSIDHILHFQENHPNRLREFSEELVEKSKKKTPKFLKRMMVDATYKHQIKESEKDVMNCTHLRNVISNDGDIIPFEYATDFKWIFSKIDFEIPEYMIDMILSESASRFKKQKETEEKEEQERIKAEEIIKQQQVMENRKKHIDMLNDKKRRRALQALKLYLNEDKPISYINDIEFERIVNYLRISGMYSELQIMKIKTAIRNNNDRIVAEEKREKINNAINILLADSEAQILNEAKNIFENDSKIVSGKIIKDIEESYNAILNLLLSLYEVVDKDNTYYNDFAEYLIMSIEELNELINSYKACNYELLLSLKESN